MGYLLLKPQPKIKKGGTPYVLKELSKNSSLTTYFSRERKKHQRCPLRG
jgi:hypothetical protein